MIRASFLVLIGRALLHVLRRWWQYGILVIAAFACEAAVFFAWRNDAALLAAGVLFPPIVAAGTYALVGRDEGLVSAAWPRVLQRIGLVIVLDFIAAVVSTYALAAFSAGDPVMGVALLAVDVSLIYADVFAVLGESAHGLLFFRAIERSTFAAWNGLQSIGRSISLMALQMLAYLASQHLQLRLEGAHVQHASFWAQMPLGTIIVPPLSALTALVFLDATGHEAKRTCGE